MVALGALAFCPEYGTDLSNETAHILTVVLGAAVVVVPTGYLLPIILPNPLGDEDGRKTFFDTNSERAALLIGILMGAFLFWVDAHRAVVRSLLPILNLVSPVMGLFLTYACFARQLGLASDN